MSTSQSCLPFRTEVAGNLNRPNPRFPDPGGDQEHGEPGIDEGDHCIQLVVADRKIRAIYAKIAGSAT